MAIIIKGNLDEVWKTSDQLSPLISFTDLVVKAPKKYFWFEEIAKLKAADAPLKSQVFKHTAEG